MHLKRYFHFRDTAYAKMSLFVTSLFWQKMDRKYMNDPLKTLARETKKWRAFKRANTCTNILSLTLSKQERERSEVCVREKASDRERDVFWPRDEIWFGYMALQTVKCHHSLSPHCHRQLISHLSHSLFDTLSHSQKVSVL